jgi:hypothetical protein
MPVYIDNMNAPYGRMKMCHMIADTHEELMAMVKKIGVQKKWIQQEGLYSEHFDISLAKKKMAIQCGAIEVDQKQLVLRTYMKLPENDPKRAFLQRELE